MHNNSKKQMEINTCKSFPFFKILRTHAWKNDHIFLISHLPFSPKKVQARCTLWLGVVVVVVVAVMVVVVVVVAGWGCWVRVEVGGGGGGSARGSIVHVMLPLFYVSDCNVMWLCIGWYICLNPGGQ